MIKYVGFLSLLLACTAQAKTTVDLVVKNGWVLTMNNTLTEHNNGAIAIDKGKIIAIGNSDLAKSFQAKTVIDADGGLILPGLINTHTHASMSVFRSLGDDVPDRLHGYVFPLEKQFVSREMVATGAQLANIEMLKGGVTTYADMYYFEEEVAKTVDIIGMRAILGQTIIKYPQADAKTPKDAIERTLAFIKQYQHHPRITPAFAPHGPYTNSTEDLKTIATLSIKHQVPVLTHLAESVREQEVIHQRTNGLSSIAYLANIGALNDLLIGAHVINADAKDIQLLAKYDVGVAHNMSANIKSAKGVAPVPNMLKANVDVGLGTDGPMSGNTLSVIDEFDQVAKLHKLVNKNRNLMPAVEVIKMATIGGAKALNMDKQLGSLEVGKKADLIVINTKSANMTPVFNPYSALVYSASSYDVQHAIVDGELLMKDRQILTLDEKLALKKARQFSEKIKHALLKQGKTIQ